MNNADRVAFPADPNTPTICGGLTKREYMATQIFAANLAQTNVPKNISPADAAAFTKKFAEGAVSAADHLLSALNKYRNL